MRPLNEKDGGDGGPFPPGALLRADSHRLRAGESSPSASAQAGGGRSSSMTHFKEFNMALLKLKTKPSTPIVTSAITVRRREVPALLLPVVEPEPPPPVTPPTPKAVKRPSAPRKVKQPPPTLEELTAAREARLQHCQWLMVEIMRRWPSVFPETETDLRPWAIGISKHVHSSAGGRRPALRAGRPAGRGDHRERAAKSSGAVANQPCVGNAPQLDRLLH